MFEVRDHGRETRAPPEGWSWTGEASNLDREVDPHKRLRSSTVLFVTNTL
jgi:hypothetical protein